MLLILRRKLGEKQETERGGWENCYSNRITERKIEIKSGYIDLLDHKVFGPHNKHTITLFILHINW